jgi:two-component system, NtrC family, nitrogen regulation sensor histidine kinase NtrY
MARIARMVAARRQRSAGSRLHLRLSALFAVIALVPAVTVAVFAVITINFGLEGWFSDRVRNVVGSSLAAAEAYQNEQEAQPDRGRHGRGLALAQRVLAADPLIPRASCARSLPRRRRIQRGLRVAFIIDGDGALRLRGDGRTSSISSNPRSGRAGPGAGWRDWC